MALRPISAPRAHDEPRDDMTTRLPFLRALTLAGLAAIGLAVSLAAGAGAAQRGVAAANPIDDAAPAWSPDGKTIAFSSRTEPDSGPTPWQIYTVKATGGARHTLTHGSLDSIDLAWSPDGKKIAFSRIAGGQVISSGHVYVMSSTGGQPEARCRAAAAAATTSCSTGRPTGRCSRSTGSPTGSARSSR